MPDDEEVELGWIRVRRLLSPGRPAGVDVDVEHSDDLPVLDALGMLAAAQQIVWEDTDEEDDDA